MTTENLQTQTQTAEATPFVVSDSEEMTPQERAYFEGKGEVKAEEAVAAPPTEAGSAKVAEEVAAAPQEDGGEEVVIVGKDGKPRAQNGRFVPHQALHAEREEHKKTKTALQEMRDKHVSGDARLRMLYELSGIDPDTGKPLGQAASKTAKNPLEEPTIDPAEDFLSAFSQQQRRTEYLQKQIAERDQKFDQKESSSKLVNTYIADAREFTRREPTFHMAYKFVTDGLLKEMAAQGIDDPDEAKREVARYERDLVSSAYQKGKNPVEMIWHIALARGFQKPDIKGLAQTADNRAAVDKINAIKSGQTASASMSSASGVAGETLTFSALAGMSDEDYAAMSAKLGKFKMRPMLGD